MQAKLQTKTINLPQTAFNIRKVCYKAMIDSVKDAQTIADKFDADNVRDICEKLYKYAKANIRYSKESADVQTAKTLARILYDKKGDCKHYTIFAGSILYALGVPFSMRMISQNFYDKEPTHIYIVAYDENDSEIICDPCMLFFDNEARYNYKYDLMINPK